MERGKDKRWEMRVGKREDRKERGDRREGRGEWGEGRGEWGEGRGEGRGTQSIKLDIIMFTQVIEVL